MKIKDVYRRKGNYIVSVIMTLLCITVTFISSVMPNVYNSLAYAYPIKYPWQICSGIFLHGSPDLSMAGTIGHLGFNLLLVLPFGMMIEKIIGSKRFLMLSVCLWIVNALAFYTIAFCVTPKGETAYGAGISGIAFSYGIIGLYSLFRLAKNDLKSLFKQLSFYLLLNIVVVMLVMINPYIAGVSSMILHLVAVVAGVIYILIDHRKYDVFFS